jgi:hypothetical protein
VIADELRGVATLDDLKRVLIAARREEPRRLSAIEFDREQFAAGVDAQAIVQRFATRHPEILVHAEVANLVSHPAFVAAVARLTR